MISFADAFHDFKSRHIASGIFNVIAGVAGLGGAGGLVKVGKAVASTVAAAKVASLANNSKRLKQGADLVRNAADTVTTRLAQNPSELQSWLTPGEFKAAEVLGFLQNRMYGRGFERAVAKELEQMGAPLSYAGRGWGPDFIGTGPLKGLSFELTTPGSVASHLGRWNPAQAVITYERPLPVSVFFGK